MTSPKQRDIDCDASLERRDISHQNTEIESAVKTSIDPASSDSIPFEISSKLSPLSRTLACAVEQINDLQNALANFSHCDIVSTLDSSRTNVEQSKMLLSSSTVSHSVPHHCNGKNSDLKLADQPSDINTGTKESSSTTGLRLADQPSDGVASLSDITTEKYGSSPHLGLADPLSNRVSSFSDITTERPDSTPDLGVADPTSEKFALVPATITEKPDSPHSAVAIASSNPFPRNYDSSLPSDSELSPPAEGKMAACFVYIDFLYRF